MEWNWPEVRERLTIGDCCNKYEWTFFEKPGWNRIWVRLLVWTVGQDLYLGSWTGSCGFRIPGGMSENWEIRESGRRRGWMRRWCSRVAGKKRSVSILPVKKRSEAVCEWSASLGLSEAEDTRLEYLVLFFWKRGWWACCIGCGETWRRTSQQQTEYVSRCFQHSGGWIEMHGGW